MENKDFRELMDKYNKPRVFLYLDPSYLSSGKKYRNKFTMQDLRDLKGKMDNNMGSHLLNLSTYHEGMEETFGEPDKVIDYANPLTENGKKKWGCGYWWKLSNEH